MDNKTDSSGSYLRFFAMIATAMVAMFFFNVYQFVSGTGSRVVQRGTAVYDYDYGWFHDDHYVGLYAADV